MNGAKGFVVVLEKALYGDELNITLTALQRIKGVTSVEPVEEQLNDQLNRSVMRLKLLTEIMELVREKK